MGLNFEQKQRAIELAAEGKTLKEIRKELDISQKTFSNARQDDPKFEDSLTRARFEGIEELADSLQTIVDEEKDTYKARLKSENIKWLISKRKPLVYGDRIDVNIRETVDLRGALDEAKARILRPVSDLTKSLVPQVVELIPIQSHTTTGSESVEDNDASEISPADIFS